MRFNLALLASAALFFTRASASPVEKRVQASTPVNPGGVHNLIITSQNTLNATNEQAVPSSGEGDLESRATSQLPLSLTNSVGGAINAYITALDPQGRIVFVQSNGQFYYPPCDSSYTTPREITANIAIPLNTAKDSVTKVVLPNYISSGRVWFAQGSLHFYSVWNSATSTPGLVQPSFVNPQDPSAGVNWGFVELTNNASGIFANISYVDFVGLPIGMSLQTASGVQTVKGLRQGSVSTICSALASQQNSDGQPWGSLCQSDNSGYLRAVAPYDYQSSGNGAFSSYFTNYVNQVWSYYSTNTLTINTQTSSGNVACKVSNNQLTCNGDNRGYAKPTSADILGCNSGPFAIQSTDNSIHLAVVPRLCAAFNRATLLNTSGGNVQPGPAASTYYQNTPNNEYSKIVHQQETDGKGYAFSYDDVTPTGGPNQSGLLSDPNPQLLTFNVGGA